jgi:hypothetical protein
MQSSLMAGMRLEQFEAAMTLESLLARAAWMDVNLAARFSTEFSRH